MSRIQLIILVDLKKNIIYFIEKCWISEKYVHIYALNTWLGLLLHRYIKKCCLLLVVCDIQIEIQILGVSFQNQNLKISTNNCLKYFTLSAMNIDNIRFIFTSNY